jgi:hypothetical protein
MADLTSSDVIVTMHPGDRNILGKLRMNIGSMAFGDSAKTYPFGGIPLPAIGQLGLNKGIKALDIVASIGCGYEFRHDKANGKIKLFGPAPPIVYEEAQTITGNAITLDYPAAAILSISYTDNAIDMIDISDTLAASGEAQLAATIAWGERTTINFSATPADDVVVYVTYITQAWKEVFDNRLRIADMATATHVAKPAKVLCFIESCNCKDTGGDSVMSKPGYIRGGDAAATTEAEIDWTDSGESDKTTLTFAAGDAVTHIDITYIELPATGFLASRMVEDEDCAIAAEVGASAYPMLFPCFGGGLPDYTAANEEAPYTMAMLRGDAIGTIREFKIDFGFQKTLVGTPLTINSTASDAVSLTYMWGIPTEIPKLVPLEIVDGTIIDATVLEFMAWGQ